MRDPPLPRIVVADIGATNARFAVADLATLELADIRHGPCAEHASLHAAMAAYLANLANPPRDAVLAVAGPVAQEDISLTNLSWSFAKSEFCRAGGFDDLLVLNDFEALAHSLPHLARRRVAPHRRRGGGRACAEACPRAGHRPRCRGPRLVGRTLDRAAGGGRTCNSRCRQRARARSDRAPAPGPRPSLCRARIVGARPRRISTRPSPPPAARSLNPLFRTT